ncbi:MAG: YggU family protein [Thermoplasmata archaeon]|nr:YggU family protein [Thermoplasmata archaeon]NIT76850.1 YggU family protein [Thermoplasmata archaeon]NIU48782.1 YggU family protein [Thermoplasmata archaeon]NIY03221.1 YggU family protein [Thermoplasmata archaeon]
MTIDLYVEPGASGQQLGPYDPWRQRIKVRVTAPASEGKANEELARLLGDVLGVPPKDVRILRGATTRRKTVHVLGTTLEVATEALGGILDEGDAPG